MDSDRAATSHASRTRPSDMQVKTHCSTSQMALSTKRNQREKRVHVGKCARCQTQGVHEEVEQRHQWDLIKYLGLLHHLSDGFLRELAYGSRISVSSEWRTDNASWLTSCTVGIASCAAVTRHPSCCRCSEGDPKSRVCHRRTSLELSSSGLIPSPDHY